MATLFLLVGLPAAGKSTVAKQLVVAHGALRLTPDEWMIPLFGESGAGGKRDVLEGRMISVALQLLTLGNKRRLGLRLLGQGREGSSAPSTRQRLAEIIVTTELEGVCEDVFDEASLVHRAIPL